MSSHQYGLLQVHAGISTPCVIVLQVELQYLIHPFRGTRDTCCISDNKGNCYRNIALFTVYMHAKQLLCTYKPDRERSLHGPTDQSGPDTVWVRCHARTCTYTKVTHSH